MHPSRCRAGTLVAWCTLLATSGCVLTLESTRYRDGAVDAPAVDRIVGDARADGVPPDPDANAGDVVMVDVVIPDGARDAGFDAARDALFDSTVDVGTDTPVPTDRVDVSAADAAPDSGTCLGGAVPCGGRCTVLHIDDYNCGACDRACTSMQSCVGGVCVAGVCHDDGDCTRGYVCNNRPLCGVVPVCKPPSVLCGCACATPCSATSCGGGLACGAGGCCGPHTCSTGIQCAIGEQCQGGQCVVAGACVPPPA